ncbi:cysteine-rich and transmembrane domain-containing protein 1-like [Ruditapes philippinarum]|uniref:cysteine-rich and transmembrane domain-containing protein 1-like n=1 Tax=Ruditapes philippinarum TaxID=129788 RepID=UPI00295B31BD|nr:cysteine-rich and transmembrane domain-containing protein 1-like [Ruditapes philippinarum]
MSYTNPSAPYPQQPPPYGATGQYNNGPYPPAGAYQPGYPQQGPYQQQPQQTTVYVYNDDRAQQRRDQELAEDCCLLACCWAMLCCCLANQ